MANKQIKIRLVRDNAQLPESKKGNWYDCFTSGLYVSHEGTVDLRLAKHYMKTKGVVKVYSGDTLVVFLGFATDMGKGYEGELRPRSSTFNKYGLILGNSVGTIDDSYNGDNDEWVGVFYCTRPGFIPVNSRLLQMNVKKSTKCDFIKVDTLGNEDRGGYGTTGQ